MPTTVAGVSGVVIPPVKADSPELIAEAHFSKGEYSQAKTVYKRALLRSDWATPTCRVKLACAYAAIGEHGKARSTIQGIKSDAYKALSLTHLRAFATTVLTREHKPSLDILHAVPCFATSAGRRNLAVIAISVANHAYFGDFLNNAQPDAKMPGLRSVAQLYENDQAGLARRLMLKTEHLSKSGFDEALWTRAHLDLTPGVMAHWTRRIIDASPERALHTLVAFEARLRMSLDLLSPAQKLALRKTHVVATSHPRATEDLYERGRAHKFDRATINRLRDYVRDEAPLIINFPLKNATLLLQDGKYKNQFETKTSCGKLSEDSRRTWESRLFQGAYDATLSGSERPRYGTINAAKYRRGATQYGEAVVVLADHVRDVATITPKDSSHCGSSEVGELRGAFDHVLHATSDDLFIGMVEASQGHRVNRCDKVTTGSYLEVQLHREISFADDAKKIVLNRSEHANPAIPDAVALAKYANVRLAWHGTWRSGSKERADALATFAQHGWEVQSWHYDVRYDYFSFAPHRQGSTWSYAFEHHAFDKDAFGSKLSRIGLSGQQIVGYSCTPSGVGAGHHLLLKSHVGESTPTHYKHLWTTRLKDRLREWEPKGWKLCGISKYCLEAGGDPRYSLILVSGNIDGHTPAYSHRLIEFRASIRNPLMSFENAISHTKVKNKQATIAAVTSHNEIDSADAVHNHETFTVAEV